MTIQNSEFYKAVEILADFANFDTTARLNHSLCAWCDYEDSGFSQYEILLGKTRNILYGISSSVSYMRLSILQVERENITDKIEKDGFNEYDLYRYHYIVFSHSVALLQDLLFKLSSLIYRLDVPKRMIGWDKLKRELDNNNLTVQKDIFEKFYGKFSTHIGKRNTFSHEGLLTYSTLDNFYMTLVWSRVPSLSKMEKNQYPQYTKGNEDNFELLQKTKEQFLDELNQLVLEAERFAINLCDSCLEDLLSRIDFGFLNKHSMNLKRCNHEPLNKYLERIGL